MSVTFTADDVEDRVRSSSCHPSCLALALNKLGNGGLRWTRVSRSTFVRTGASCTGRVERGPEESFRPWATATCFTSSQPIRIESETLRALRERSAQSGESIVRLAERYIGEGMRLDRHPGIAFRDGPAGRRAVVIGGPDVWEVDRFAAMVEEDAERLEPALERERSLLG